MIAGRALNDGKVTFKEISTVNENIVLLVDITEDSTFEIYLYSDDQENPLYFSNKFKIVVPLLEECREWAVSEEIQNISVLQSKNTVKT